MAMRTGYIMLLLVGLTLACHRGPPGTVTPEDTPATLKVDNQRPFDMTIYIVENGVRERLGRAAGNFVTSFTIPLRYSRRAAILRFIADPVGSRALPVTQDITVEPGDEVLMRIQP
jgi:hypothetical protein